MPNKNIVMQRLHAGWKVVLPYRQTGLRLCDNYSGNGATQCANKSSSCSGAANSGACYPNNVWSGTPDGSNYSNRNLNSGTFKGPYSNAATYAFGVRCVLDMN